ncbi:hypothetical protein AD953_09765, partial [Acetobacter malorum]
MSAYQDGTRSGRPMPAISPASGPHVSSRPIVHLALICFLAANPAAALAQTAAPAPRAPTVSAAVLTHDATPTQPDTAHHPRTDAATTPDAQQTSTHPAAAPAPAPAPAPA